MIGRDGQRPITPWLQAHLKGQEDLQQVRSYDQKGGSGLLVGMGYARKVLGRRSRD